METLLKFAKHETPKKTTLEWIKESEKQKADKFMELLDERMAFIRAAHGANIINVRSNSYPTLFLK